MIERRRQHYIAGVPNLTRTLALIKPDAFDRRLTGKIVDAALDAGLAIVAMKSVNMNRAQAEAFYAVHRDRPFFASLVAFMTSGTTVAMVLEGDGAVPAWRDAMGATDPAEAAPGTIRRRFAESIERNCCHGSDSDANAAVEIGCFFSGEELLR
ncbi:MAG: nucleoside-diphosphate kinase [Spirochaetaceae bacterium]|nr:nucleoside-diphosphate kinase [Spirochaetaceae bacterium]